MISENENLTADEENELNQKDYVTYTDNFVPYLTSTKQYYLHYKLDNSSTVEKEEITNRGEINLEPQIQLRGSSKVRVKIGENYQEQGATAHSVIDGDLTNNIITSGNVDTNTLGQYIITYSITDSKNQTKQIQRLVVVEPEDTEAPVITLNGQEYQEIEIYQNYSEDGATAQDNIDGDLTHKIQIKGFVDSNTLGSYTILYEVSDEAGNVGRKTRIVRVKKPDEVAPSISLIGNQVEYLIQGQEYVEKGATASDDRDGDLTNEIVITGSVDTSTLGSYEITYRVADS